LEKRYEILANQLRHLMSIDEFQKTNEQKKTEAILFNELINLVNKRNELVIQLDEENKLFNDDQIIDDFIQNKSTFLQKEKQCSIQ
jgi:Cdc6-like AAA superfamily ATPase